MRTSSPTLTVPCSRPRSGRTHLSHETIVTGALAEDLWQLYYECFEPLEELAILSHLYPRETFDRLLVDPSIVKIVGWQDGRPVGLAMITNNLDVVPQISPRFLRRRYPDHAARDAIYFGIMIFVAPWLRGRTLFARLMVATGQLAGQADGVAVIDVCDHNIAAIRWPEKLATLASMYRGAAVERVDAQSYWAVTLPEALSDEHRLVS